MRSKKYRQTNKIRNTMSEMSENVKKRERIKQKPWKCMWNKNLVEGLSNRPDKLEEN